MLQIVVIRLWVKISIQRLAALPEVCDDVPQILQMLRLYLTLGHDTALYIFYHTVFIHNCNCKCNSDDDDNGNYDNNK
jgi:hypothetical protein